MIISLISAAVRGSLWFSDSDVSSIGESGSFSSSPLSEVSASGQDLHLSRAPWYNIPGPNPIVLNSGNGPEWDALEMECAGGVYKQYGVDPKTGAIASTPTYYLMYHGLPQQPGISYQQGMAKSISGPLGPFVKDHMGPILPLGKEGEWDSEVVASGNIVKISYKDGGYNEDKWAMLYEGGNSSFQHLGVGLATAPSIDGPWRKFAHNPIIPGTTYDFYVASVIVHPNGTVSMYAENIHDNDQGPIGLWTADHIAGPYTFISYVLEGGADGTWDRGGFSESKVSLDNGLYTIFYSGARGPPKTGAKSRVTRQKILAAAHDRVRAKGGFPKRRRLQSTHLRRSLQSVEHEEIGFAYSMDGVHFVKSIYNPVSPLANNPLLSAMAEAHVHVESPFYYVYHTLRWNPNANAFGGENDVPFAGPTTPYNGREEIGVQILTMKRDFGTITWPALNWENLDANVYGLAGAQVHSAPLLRDAVGEISLTMEGCPDCAAHSVSVDVYCSVGAARDGLLRWELEPRSTFPVREDRILLGNVGTAQLGACRFAQFRVKTTGPSLALAAKNVSLIAELFSRAN